jgi:transcriptional regulator with XRE-family HTH domain
MAGCVKQLWEHMRRFGEKMRVLRKRRGMTITGLAEALGYAPTSNSYISEIETGKRRPKIDFVLKVAHYFGVTTDQLVQDDIELDAAGDDPAESDG